jgi:hypothetical protein
MLAFFYFIDHQQRWERRRAGGDANHPRNGARRGSRAELETSVEPGNPLWSRSRSRVVRYWHDAHCSMAWGSGAYGEKVGASGANCGDQSDRHCFVRNADWRLAAIAAAGVPARSRQRIGSRSCDASRCVGLGDQLHNGEDVYSMISTDPTLLGASCYAC